MNFKIVSLYLKALIRIGSLFTRLRPEDLEVRIQWQPDFHEDHAFAVAIKIWFTIDGRMFCCGLPSDRRFSYIHAIPEAFLRAYKRAQYKIRVLNG